MALKGIYIQNKPLILPPGIALRFELVNTAFDYDNIPSGLVWEFDLPVKGNSDLLDFAHFIETKISSRIYDATVIVGANEIIGKLVIQKAGNIKYSCSFIVNGFSADVLNKNLKDVIPGGVEFVGTPDTDSLINHANDVITKVYPEVNYNFPSIINTEFYSDTNDEFLGVINTWDDDLQTFIKNELSVSNGNAYNKANLSPQLYLVFILKTLFSYFGYKLEGNFINNNETKKILVYNNYALDKVRPIYKTIAGMANQYFPNVGPNTINFDDVSSPGFEDIDGNFNTGTHIYTPQWDSDIIVRIRFTISGLNITSGVAQPAVIVIINNGGFAQQIGQFTGNLDTIEFDQTSIEQNFVASDSFLFQVVYVNGLTDEVIVGSYTITNAVVEINATNFRPLNIYNPSIVYANHVPDITVNDFLVSVRKFFGLRIDFDPYEKKVSLDFNKTILSTKAEDLTSKAALNYSKDTNDGAGYTLDFDFQNDAQSSDNFKDISQYTNAGTFASPANLLVNTVINQRALTLSDNGIYVVGSDLKWKRLCDNFYPLILGTGDIEIVPLAAPMFMREKETEGVTILAPAIEQTGSSPAFDIGLNDPSLRFFIWHGKHNNSDGNTYPFASSYNYNYEGVNIGNLSLRFDDENYGLYQFSHQSWLNFLLNTETIIRQFKLTVNDIFGPLFKIKKSVQHVENVFKKVTVEVTKTETKVSEVEHCKIL